MNKTRTTPSRDNRRVVPALVVVLTSITLIAVTAGCSEKSPETLVEERCSQCHALTIVKTSQKTREGWEATVNRMIELGARLDDQQTQEVIDYLSETYGSE
jgi:competence protein ComEA